MNAMRDAGLRIGLLADILTDLESTRIANENRLRALHEAGLLGVSTERRLTSLVDGLRAVEHDAELALRHGMRSHPLGPWVERTVGVGLKQGARLLAAVGDPYWNSLHDRPRTVSELRAYCGMHVIHPSHASSADHAAPAGVEQSGDTAQVRTGTQTGSGGVAPKRMRGKQANWNTQARTRLHLVAVSCIKSVRSPYRVVYEAAREKYATAVHNQPCPQCGPAGHPAPAGSPLSLGHQHARGIRAVGRAILEDLWAEARAIHQEANDVAA